MSTLDRRLTALEQRSKQEDGIRGIRIFQQDEDDPTVFYEIPGAFYQGEQGYSDAEISALCAQGWKCITVVYGGQEHGTIAR